MTVADEPACAGMHERLIEAAREVFTSEGYRASMDAIAARAGVAKQTLYNHFPCKADLFGATVCNASTHIAVLLEGEPANLRDSLITFALTFRGRALGDDGLAFFRALTAEGTRFPEMSQTFYASGPARTVARLADFLGRAMEAGKLRRDDAVFAAEMLIGMLLGIEHARRLCQVASPDETEEHRVSRIVDCFLRAFAAN